MFYATSTLSSGKVNVCSFDKEAGRKQWRLVDPTTRRNIYATDSIVLKAKAEGKVKYIKVS